MLAALFLSLSPPLSRSVNVFFSFSLFDMFIIFISSYYYCFVCISATFSSRPVASSLQNSYEINVYISHTHASKCIHRTIKEAILHTAYIQMPLGFVCLCMSVCVYVYLRDVLFVCLFICACRSLFSFIVVVVLSLSTTHSFFEWNWQ